MKCSAWSSLVISVCSALVFAGAASAHLSIDPQRVQPGAEVDLVFSVPNEDDAVGVDHVTLGIPPTSSSTMPRRNRAGRSRAPARRSRGPAA